MSNQNENDQRVTTDSFFESDSDFRDLVYESQPKLRPASLYHYTDAAGLTGIVSHRQIWATHFESTNDAAEVDYGVNMAIRQIDERVKLQPADGVKFESVDAFLSGVTNRSDSVRPSEVLLPVASETLKRWKQTQPRFYEFFFVSLSMESDLLSQWRAYAADARGYALGLPCEVLQSIRTSCEDPTATYDLMKVIYDENIQNDLITKVLENAAKHLDAVLPELPHEQRRKCFIGFNAYLLACVLRLSVHFKHFGFREEDEWRLIVSTKSVAATDSNSSPIKMRVTNRGIVPYIELSAPNLSIDRIVIGPKSSSGQVDNSPDFALHQLFRSHKLPEPHLDRSSIPYR